MTNRIIQNLFEKKTTLPYTREQAQTMLGELTNLRVNLRMAAAHKGEIKELYTGMHKHVFNRALLTGNISNPSQDPNIKPVLDASEILKNKHKTQITNYRQQAQNALTNLLNLHEQMGEKNYKLLYTNLIESFRQDNPTRFQGLFDQFVSDISFISHNRLFPKAKAMATLKKLGILGMGLVLAATTFMGFGNNQAKV